MNFNFPQDIQNDLNIDKRKAYVIQINSNNKASGNNNNASYNFDWSILSDHPYNVYFAFVSSDNNTYVAGTSVTANVYISFGVNSTTYTINPNTVVAQTINYLGSLRKTISSGSNYYLYAEKTTNPPIYISGRPTNKIFSINILSDTGANYDISMLGSYVLTLYFEPA